MSKKKKKKLLLTLITLKAIEEIEQSVKRRKIFITLEQERKSAHRLFQTCFDKSNLLFYCNFITLFSWERPRTGSQKE